MTADTYTKLLHPQDNSVRTLFGDGVAATLIQRTEAHAPAIGPFVMGTDGRGAGNFIVAAGAFRKRERTDQPELDANDSPQSDSHLYMDRPGIFSFSLETVPKVVSDLLAKARLKLDDIDLFVFHQANIYMLDFLRKKYESQKTNS